jgi:hypothetical protein
MDSLNPTTEEVRNWLLSTLLHSCQVEYYLNKLDWGKSDFQRPHDICGEGNKYSWDVVRGLSVQSRSQNPIFFKNVVLPSIEAHRKGQYHHQMWNNENPKATKEELKTGAVDSICSLLDNRTYQGGRHSFNDIIEVIKSNKTYKHKWFWMVYLQMKELEEPKTDLIEELEDFPNIGLPKATYERIVERTREAVRDLRGKNGYVGVLAYLYCLGRGH